MFQASSRSEGRAGTAGGGDPFARGRDGASGWRIRTRKGVSESTSRREGSSASNPTNPPWSASEIMKNLLRTLRPIAAKDW